MRNVWHAANGPLRVLYLLMALGLIADAVLVVLQMQAGNYLSVAALVLIAGITLWAFIRNGGWTQSSR